MIDQPLTKTKVWLSAKDNWLGEGAFRPAPAELERPARLLQQQDDEQTRRATVEPDYSEVYFAHG